VLIARKRGPWALGQTGQRRNLSRAFFVSLPQCFLWVALCPGQEVSETEAHLRHIFLAAKAAQDRGDYRSAANTYEEILKLRPKLAEAWANLGLMHQFLGEYSRADHDFQVALSKNPQLYVPNLFLGLNLIRTHQPRDALRYLDQAENLNPRDEQAALGLARTYQALHEDTAANDWFYRAKEVNPRDPDAWYGLGVTYLSLQDAAVLRLRKLNLRSVYARMLVGEGFLQQGRTNDAIAIFNELLKSPGQPPCLLATLGSAYT
jgi:tetratricopeptide (TPR) repeat protein